MKGTGLTGSDDYNHAMTHASSITCEERKREREQQKRCKLNAPPGSELERGLQDSSPVPRHFLY